MNKQTRFSFFNWLLGSGTGSGGSNGGLTAGPSGSESCQEQKKPLSCRGGFFCV